jgi:hypothetical protein
MFRLVLLSACLSALGLIACDQPAEPQTQLLSPIAGPEEAASQAAAALHAITHPRNTP